MTDWNRKNLVSIIEICTRFQDDKSLPAEARKSFSNAFNVALEVLRAHPSITGRDFNRAFDALIAAAQRAGLCQCNEKAHSFDTCLFVRKALS